MPDKSQAFREAVTAFIAIVILCVSTWMMVRTFNAAGRLADADAAHAAAFDKAYSTQKDIMLYALALLGTVTGYYLGRVPAELRASKATQKADEATKDAKQQRAEAAEVRRSIRAKATEMLAGLPPPRSTLSAGDVREVDSANVRQFAESLIDIADEAQ